MEEKKKEKEEKMKEEKKKRDEEAKKRKEDKEKKEKEMKEKREKEKKEKEEKLKKEKEAKEKKEKNAGKEDYELIYNIISKHFFLQTLNNQAKNEIIISMSLYSLKAGKTLYTQGNMGNFWYIVQSGQLNRYLDDKLISTINPGDSFGERALMKNYIKKCKK